MVIHPITGRRILYVQLNKVPLYNTTEFELKFIKLFFLFFLPTYLHTHLFISVVCPVYNFYPVGSVVYIKFGTFLFLP